MALTVRCLVGVLGILECLVRVVTAVKLHTSKRQCRNRFYMSLPIRKGLFPFGLPKPGTKVEDRLVSCAVCARAFYSIAWLQGFIGIFHELTKLSLAYGRT